MYIVRLVLLMRRLLCCFQAISLSEVYDGQRVLSILNDDENGGREMVANALRKSFQEADKDDNGRLSRAEMFTTLLKVSIRRRSWSIGWSCCCRQVLSSEEGLLSLVDPAVTVHNGVSWSCLSLVAQRLTSPGMEDNKHMSTP